MIIMQYKLKLPADYSMDIIEKRIEENGSKLDGFPGLYFKAYLISKINQNYAKENSYAPLYVWENTNGMNTFLQTSGFKKLTEDFGWPKIETWTTLKEPSIELIKENNWLSMDNIIIPEYSDLSSLNINSHLCAWDVSKWELLNINFQTAPSPNKKNYRIKYIAS